ncbi:hypothetical protein [Amycolatopsis magusensis]|uniref:Uncharacterized protein n=1 Tax=Amycolatopsis magusensis TaxID=882444 RepID=A0ABS4PUR9_9PSEU|nr:hypothetical protein [Amycolatopsis magusensis]MBP2182588.1 hypothetical protein [Amycolatopsis magusensis]MDI5982434.1 hypothetical protein [Amycolatopsis magusensis]
MEHVDPAQPMMVVRLLRGVVGETRRVAHLVPAHLDSALPSELEALCGELLQAGQAELLPGLRGMPCDRCLAMSARRLRQGLVRAS